MFGANTICGLPGPSDGRSPNRNEKKKLYNYYDRFKAIDSLQVP